MRKWIGMAAAGSTLILLLSLQTAFAKGYESFHKDYRKTPKLVLNVEYYKLGEFDPKKIAESYLREFGELYGVSNFSQELEFSKVKHSLLGTHVHFSQTTGGFEVRNGEIIVSVLKESSQVYKVFNNFYPQVVSLTAEKPIEAQKPLSGDKVISKSAAYDVAWQDLRVHGELLYRPAIRAQYIVSKKGNFRLVYATHLNTQAPYGSWMHLIDAKTGEIVQAKNTNTSQKLTYAYEKRKDYKGKVYNRRRAFLNFAEKEAKRKAASKRIKRQISNGEGLVFDPDPRTTLNDPTLTDNSPAEAFEDAYFKRTLNQISFAINKEIKEDGSVETSKEFFLMGPWVRLADFEPPFIAPSTSKDGVWSAKRGDIAFNDVMTYYHLDKSQRYIQSLGYKGQSGIQHLSIKVDANGVGGSDNSHYSPRENTLAFGHGCVDDNEDADVILHEYGHAIHKSINDNWEGGDARAIGEGFGDYWAASYSVSTENGLIFKPNKVFSWDGVSSCWPGRKLDKTHMFYDKDHQYGAHRSIGDDQSDELWSTPLFQSLKHLMSLGISRQEADRIVLEAHFGLGAGLTMRDLAHATVNAGEMLYPDGIHSKIFKQKFAYQDIIAAPRPVLNIGGVSLAGIGKNEMVDPGEEVEITVNLNNSGTLAAGTTTAKLTTENSLIEVANGKTTYSSVDMAQTSANSEPLRIKVSPEFQCGEKIDLALELDTEVRMLKKHLTFSLPTGKPIGSTLTAVEEHDIPDSDGSSAVSSIVIASDGKLGKDFSIDVNIEHSYIGDLTITLESPSGRKATLWRQGGEDTQNLVGNFPSTLEPAGYMGLLKGEKLRGEWKLTVTDSEKENTGKIISWAINNVTGYSCE